MTTPEQRNWIRKSSLLVVQGEKALDLSQMRIKFSLSQSDVQTPNSAVIRVYNLSKETADKVQKEFSRVVLNAGYENGSFGAIFDGTIKQFRRGRESGTDTYLDILAADGDTCYNFGVCNASVPKGNTPRQVLDLATAQAGSGVAYAPTLLNGTELIRGKVLFGMWRDIVQQTAVSNGSTWSIQNGKIQVIPLDSYLPGEAVVLNTGTGLIGMPEQTEEGIKMRALLNPKLRIGGLVKLDNKLINQLFQQSPSAAPVPYNQYAGIQHNSSVTDDGVYRIYVVEHLGDTRGREWYSDMVCLAVDQKKVMAQ